MKLVSLNNQEGKTGVEINRAEALELISFLAGQLAEDPINHKIEFVVEWHDEYC